jgi:hypothetical protein
MATKATGRKAEGGARPNAGRKAGVPNKDRRKAIAKAEAGGIMPLDLMLKVMRKHDALATLAEKKGDKDEAQGQWTMAAERARDAAPYLHPRLQSITQKDERIDLSKLTDDELGFLHRIKSKQGLGQSQS